MYYNLSFFKKLEFMRIFIMEDRECACMTKSKSASKRRSLRAVEKELEGQIGRKKDPMMLLNKISF